MILPDSIDIDQADAKIKNGVLVLTLPLMRPEEKQKVKLKIKKANQRKRM
ncbi:MAG: Hsp20/alpha crystallin family protein [Candidatus Paceibacterota bacterium]